jgi:hypothetical protein
LLLKTHEKPIAPKVIRTQATIFTFCPMAVDGVESAIEKHSNVAAQS